MHRFWIVLCLVPLSQASWAAESPRTNLHFQVTSVTQDHGPFSSPYQGNNSLQPVHESATSLTMTLFGGLRLWQGGEIYANPELIGGQGISHTLGIAGYPNGEIYRVDEASPKWSLSRVYFKQVFGFGGVKETISDDKNQLATEIDVERFTFVLGKFALNDFFDNNSFSHDPRTQFLNWAFMDNGAWDYAADTRGYSWGIYLEYNVRKWAIRFASVMVPRFANQLEMDKNIPAHRGDNLEGEYRYQWGERKGVFRLLAYANTANMGDYRETIDTPSFGMDVTKSRQQRTKYGIGLNWEQQATDHIGLFSRLGLDDGREETWAFTEIDRSFSLGAHFDGQIWHRPKDSAGVAYALNLLSNDHRDYLAAGGYGFIIGDGQLSYSPEHIFEFYYSYCVMEGLDLSGDYQFVLDPAYNSDRGPVSIVGLRLHYEI